MKNQNQKPQTPKGASGQPSSVPPLGGGGGLSVDDFNLDPYLISIQWHQPKMEQNQVLEVCRSCFEQWLQATGRLDWVTNTTDHYGEHQQNNGTMATEEYWNYADYEQKTEDLKAFIIAEVKAQEELN